MAVPVRTTLSSAVAIDDRSIVVASATDVGAGDFIRIDEEWMQVSKEYSSGTTVNVLRGVNGSVTAAHKVTAGVVHGSAADFTTNPDGTGEGVTLPAQRARRIISLTAAATLTLPKSGEDLFVILNGTSVIALTVPVPTKDLDGCALYIAGNGAAAHTATFTGGLSGAGASYDVITVNATAPVVLGPFWAVNGLWQASVAVPMAGTVTNVTATVA